MVRRGVLSRIEIAIEILGRSWKILCASVEGFRRRWKCPPQRPQSRSYRSSESCDLDGGRSGCKGGRGEPTTGAGTAGGVGLVFEGRWLSTIIAKMSLYKNSLLLAIRQTQYQQLGTDNFEVSEAPPSRLLSGYQSQLLDAVYSEFGEPINTDEFASQCCAVNMKIKPHVERILGTPTLITIGAVRAFGVPVVSVLEPSLFAMAVSGDYHVWLTLPWLEVLDLTLLASIAKGKGAELSASRPLMGYPESFPDFEWSPWFVGSAAAMRLVTPAK